MQRKVEYVLDNGTSFNRSIWGIICLEIWFNEFFDNQQ